MRRWIGRIVLVALAFPSLGPWPWLIADALATGAGPATREHRDDHAHETHRGASDIPGTPTHPADHHCVECQVLQHLARCIPEAPPARARSADAGSAGGRGCRRAMPSISTYSPSRNATPRLWQSSRTARKSCATCARRGRVTTMSPTRPWQSSGSTWRIARSMALFQRTCASSAAIARSHAAR
jgi:hypothetical protein